MKAIIACDPNGGIGYKGKLPWDKLEGDLPRFKSLTTGQKVIMGRKTWDSLPVKPLPNRTCIVLTSSIFPVPEGVHLVNNISSDHEHAWIIGGGTVVNGCWNSITEFHLSRTYRKYKCDTFINLELLEREFSCTWIEKLSDHTYEIWRRN